MFQEVLGIFDPWEVAGFFGSHDSMSLGNVLSGGYYVPSDHWTWGGTLTSDLQ